MSQTRTQYSNFYKVKLDFDSWLVISGALKLDIDIESLNFKFKWGKNETKWRLCKNNVV